MDRALCRRMHPPTSCIQSTSCHWKVHYWKKCPASFPCSCICNVLNPQETRPTYTSVTVKAPNTTRDISEKQVLSLCCVIQPTYSKFWLLSTVEYEVTLQWFSMLVFYSPFAVSCVTLSLLNSLIKIGKSTDVPLRLFSIRRKIMERGNIVITPFEIIRAESKVCVTGSLRCGSGAGSLC